MLHGIAEDFSKRCPTLRTIRFPIGFFAQHAPGTWITARDIIRLIEEQKHTIAEGASGKDELAAQVELRDLDETERRSIGAEDGQKADMQGFRPESYRDLIERINLVREMIADDPILLSSTEGDMMLADLLSFGYRLTHLFVGRLGNVQSTATA